MFHVEQIINFVNNKIMIGSEIPTDGNYNVGDIIQGKEYGYD